MTAQPAPPDPERMIAAVAELRAALDAWAAALTPALLAAAREFAAALAHLPQAPPAGQAAARPAWRSPYGPPHTRRRK
ncbi:hypothetical protein ACFQ7B_00290 [Streptomyces erythrochromogenes]|uniref:hypothetical protein n=1 Tax=Streptomyces erythrochromogenes TaxID=285574 RepID=UPI0036ACE92F